MAYDAAAAADVPQCLIDIFVCNVIKGDFAWYIQNQLLSPDEFEDMEDSAIQRCLPRVEQWVADMKVEPYVTAAMVSDTAWNGFRSQLQNFDSRMGAKL
jgi:hypothetical protein